MRKWLRWLAGAALASAVAAPAGAHPESLDASTLALGQRLRATLAAAGQAASAQPTCLLQLALKDAASGRELPGLVRVSDTTKGRPLPLPGLVAREQGWFTLPAPRSVRLPRARLVVEAVSGLETEHTSRVVDCRGRESATAPLGLTRFYDAAARGLRSGNTHLHLAGVGLEEAERYLRQVPAADGLDLAFVSYLRNVFDEATYVSNRFGAEDLHRLSRGGALLSGGEEHRHDFPEGVEGYGHVMFLNLRRLIRPVSLGPALMGEGGDGVPLRRGIGQARGDGATVLWCHGASGFEDIPSWLAGLVHVQNVFDGGRKRSYEETFYRYLDVGLEVPLSTGTDWFIRDFSRVYVPLEGELRPEAWLAQLAAGRGVVTNGPLLELRVEGQGPGAVIDLPEPRTLRAQASAAGRAQFRGIELIHNGKVVGSAASALVGRHFEAGLEASLRVDGPGWIALRVPQENFGNVFGKKIFAHTSPVYLRLRGERPFDAGAAAALAAEMERDVETITREGSFADAGEKESVLGIYREAIASLRERLPAPRTAQGGR